MTLLLQPAHGRHILLRGLVGGGEIQRVQQDGALQQRRTVRQGCWCELCAGSKEGGDEGAAGTHATAYPSVPQRRHTLCGREGDGAFGTRIQPHILSVVDDLAHALPLTPCTFTHILKSVKDGRELVVVHQVKTHSLLLRSHRFDALRQIQESVLINGCKGKQLLHLRSQTNPLPLQWKDRHAHTICLLSLIHSEPSSSQTRDRRKAYTILLQMLSQSAAYIAHTPIDYLVAHNHIQNRLSTLHPVLEQGRSGFQIARKRQHPLHELSVSFPPPLPPFSHPSMRFHVTLHTSARQTSIHE